MARDELYVVRNDDKYAYSMGDVVESLQAAGVMTDEAMQIARDVEKYFRKRHEGVIPLDTMVQRISVELADRIDEATAERFRGQTPPFVPIAVEREDGTELFSRRTLVASLEKLDLGFKEAHSIAHQVAQGLRAEGQEIVSGRDLAHRVALGLEARYGREVRLRYEAAVSQTTDLLVVEDDGHELPYSRGILAQSLMAIGLGPELSHNLAKRAEDALWRRGDVRVDRDELRSAVLNLLVDEAGEEFARRYELMRAVRRPERPIVVLIGGAAGVGKSAVASELGYRLGIPRIVSTDSVRQALRSLISPELSPVLHASSYTAWEAELLPAERAGATPKRKRVIRGFQAQVQQLGTALTAIVERNVEESVSLVMEGVHLVPGISPRAVDADALVIELVLAVDSEERHAKHFGRREGTTQRKGHEYIGHLPEIRILQSFIVEHARAAGVPVIEASDFDRAIERSIEHILNVVLEEQRRSEGASALEL